MEQEPLSEETEGHSASVSNGDWRIIVVFVYLLCRWDACTSSRLTCAMCLPLNSKQRHPDSQPQTVGRILENQV